MCSNCMSMSCKYRFLDDKIKFVVGTVRFDLPFTTVWHAGKNRYMTGCSKRKPDGVD